MDLSVTYLGLKLRNPLMPGSSSLVDDLDKVKRLEDAGAAAIVMHSLFQEQIDPQDGAQSPSSLPLTKGEIQRGSPFALKPCDFSLKPDDYLELIRKLRKAVSVPVIASVNGINDVGWVKYAGMIQEAGASALELNVYYLGTNARESGADVERRVLDTIRAVKGSITIPIAVKLLPFYSSLAHLAAQIDELGAEGLVLFNRVYQPEIDAELLEFAPPQVQLTSSTELPLRLHWVAALAGRVRMSLAVSGGVHSGLDAVRAIMAGAHAVQVVSALYRKGPEFLGQMLKDFEKWLAEHKFESIEQMRGAMSLQRCPDPGVFERTNYMRVLQSWRE